MAETETVGLTSQPEAQPQAVVPQNQNIQYVYTQPQQTTAGAAQNVQYVYTQPAQQETAQNVKYVYTQTQQQAAGAQHATVYIQPQAQAQAQAQGYHQPAHRPPEQPDDEDEKQADVQVVKWDNFRMPIPLNHATFMRKVWGTLVLQLIFTAGMIAMCMYVDEIRIWVVENYWMYWIGVFGSICVLCALFPARNNYPVNLFLLFLWTALMAYTVAMICAAYASQGMADTVMQAFGITVLVFLGLSLFSCQTKCNLMPLGLVAFMLLSVMMWWGLWALIFGWYNTSGWALMFIIIFCLLILFDVWRMCNMPVFDEGAWILGAINLYLDVINLFLWILRFMAISRN